MNRFTFITTSLYLDISQWYLHQAGSKGKREWGITALHSTTKPKKSSLLYQCSTILFERLTLGYNRKRTLSGVCSLSPGNLPVVHYQQISLRRDKPLVGIPHRNRLATLNMEKTFPFKWEWLSMSFCKAFWSGQLRSSLALKKKKVLQCHDLKSVTPNWRSSHTLVLQTDISGSSYFSLD